jgi:hypothetical protein
MLKTAVITVALVAIVGYVAYTYLSRETFVVANNGIRFMDAAETATFLKQDPDGYVKNMSPSDLYARKVTTVEKYLTRAAGASVSFSSAQRVRFIKAARDADDHLMRYNANGIDGKRLASIPWIFAMTNGDAYEDGLPHTRANIIFVSSDINEQHDALVRTLVHEKVHIFQRMHPEFMVQLLQGRGYQRWKLRMGLPRVRANPDIDPWIWMNEETQTAMVAHYTSDKPTAISDVYLEDPSFEHPYELIAYEIATNTCK